ncbi:MAG: hypothetical protein MR388_02170 [Tenericutes bacterium]|nr:hypothetical protein [Mycoplasmatota bacterium]
MEIDTRYINQLEIIINLFTIENGMIKILLLKRTEEPFKNYWFLPSNLLMTSETIEECAKATVYEYTNFEYIDLIQCNIFSQIDRLPNERIIANSLIGIVPNIVLNHHRYRKNIECKWFPINDIPKTVYDHTKIIEDAITFLKKQICDHHLIQNFLEEDFTLPELQSIYECAYGKKLDRRNFRKRMLATGKIIDSGEKVKKETGRPPRLYHFCEKENQMNP